MSSFCSNCGVQLPYNVNFCPSCGSPANVSATQTPDQSIQVGQLILSRVGEFLHKPHYNVRAASQGYSNIGAILAGFAFAAVVLVMQFTNLPDNPSDASFLRDWATIAFLIALFGCILSAVIFSVVAGEEILSPRSTMIALFGGAGFSIAASLIFWGLITLIKIFLDENVISFARILYPTFSLIQPAHLSFAALDNIYLFEDRLPTFREKAYAFVPGYIPLLLAIVLKPTGLFFPASLLVPALWFTLLLSVILIFASSVLALLVSDASHDFSLPPRKSWPALLMHSIVMGLLILLI